MSTVRRPVMRYHGGKWALAQWVISHIPDHRVYVEPYGGAGSAPHPVLRRTEMPAAETDRKYLELTLETVAGKGVAEERFQRELKKALENIQDLNTEAEKPRQVILAITLLPSETRDQLKVSVQAVAKLAPTKPAGGVAWLGERGGQPVAVTFDPKQAEMFREAEDPSVRPMRAAREGQ